MCEDYMNRTNGKPPIRTPKRKKTLRIQTDAPTPCMHQVTHGPSEWDVGIVRRIIRIGTVSDHR
jgi:hypothetical protein